jgi:hypothetical protein
VVNKYSQVELPAVSEQAEDKFEPVGKSGVAEHRGPPQHGETVSNSLSAAKTPALERCTSWDLQIFIFV